MAILNTKAFFEVGDLQVDVRCIINSIKVAWINSGKTAKELKDLTLYIKAEDKKAYFVGNGGKVSGYIALSNANDLSSSVVFN